MSAVMREQEEEQLSALENLHRPHKYLGWDTSKVGHARHKLCVLYNLLMPERAHGIDS